MSEHMSWRRTHGKTVEIFDRLVLFIGQDAERRGGKCRRWTGARKRAVRALAEVDGVGVDERCEVDLARAN